MANFFYTDTNGQKQGPVTDQQLRTMAAQGIITPNTPLETEGGHKGTAGQIRGLFATAPASTPQIPSPQSSNGKVTDESKQKNKITTALFAFLLGGLGIHRFYLGEKNAGMLYILLVFACGLSAILGLIDAVKFLMMSDEEFASKSFPETDKLFRW